MVALETAEILDGNALGPRVKRQLRRTLPLPVRKSLALLLARQRWLPQRDWWAVELIRDWAQHDPGEYHRFLWRHHMAYARTYEIDQRFGPECLHPSRVLFFEELRRVLKTRGTWARQPRSVLEVGCSMGYLLRHIEQNVFPSAVVLDGVDIDDYAIAAGAMHLKALGSRVRLRQADMLDLHHVLESRPYDLILCAGVLMYVDESEAVRVLRTLFERCSGLVALAGLAYDRHDNTTLEKAVRRTTDGSFIHNLDALVERAGGRVVARRWDGPRMIQGNTVYFVFAGPQATSRSFPPEQ